MSASDARAPAAHAADGRRLAAGPLTAAELAVTVAGLLRAADLDTLDLAMWAGRTPPPGGA